MITITEGMMIASRYEIIGKIGTGGMSDVYKAKDTTLGRYVAIKVLKPEFSEDMNFVTKFRTEASSAAGLEHPNIVNIYDVGSENEFHYIVMEYIEGITLKTYIEKKGQLSFKEAVSIAIQVGRGIEAAHNKGIIHRDIKPQNIIISTEGKVKVTDFGIAKAATSNTISSDVMGSVHYTSPEQARNGYVDGKSDIYSLGIVMYEMVTGRVPFDGDTTVAVAIQHLQEEMESPKTYAQDLPISMEKIILKCTQKNPDRRYESITALLSDLRQALINPTGDFVVIPPISQEKTRVIGMEEVNKIKQKTGRLYVDEATLVENAMRGENADDADDEEDYDEEEEINPTMDKAITIMGIAAGVVIVILIIVILVNFIGGFGSKDKDSDTQKNTSTVTEETQTETEKGIKVEDVRGLTFEDAKKLLNKAGLGIKKAGTVASDEYKEGEIVSQTPEAGSFAEEKTTVEVTVSSGPAMIEIPNVKGLDETSAYNKLVNAGFKPVKELEYSDSVEIGNVISQSPAGASLGNEGDIVTIVVSQGPKLVKVPNVINLSQESAKSELEKAGLTVGTITEEHSDTVAKDVVISQSVSADTQVAMKSTINLTVSLGKKQIEVPGVVGQTKDNAVKALKDAGLNVTVKEVYDSGVTAGNVISQSTAGGTKVDAGATVEIVVSLGREQIEVPNVISYTRDRAAQDLSAKGLNVTVKETHSSEAAGTVIGQNPVGGTKVDAGATVEITVSLGPAPSSEPTGGTQTGNAPTGEETGTP